MPENGSFRVIAKNDALIGMARTVPDVIYSREQGEDLNLTLLIPWNRYEVDCSNMTQEEIKALRCPTLVFVQGSAWTTPDFHYELPQLGALARKGYVVATVRHRDSTKGHRAPAFLQDVKTAIRFLRANADVYHVDPEHISIWGTSSGGNTALLVGLTGDDPAFRTQEYPEYSDAVEAVADCFGPADLIDCFARAFTYLDHPGTELSEADRQHMGIFTGLFGTQREGLEGRVKAISPIHLLRPDRTYPPFLILHGNRDEAVPYRESEELFNRLLAYGCHAEMICVDGGIHEGNFWSIPVYEAIEDFLERMRK